MRHLTAAVLALVLALILAGAAPAQEPEPSEAFVDGRWVAAGQALGGPGACAPGATRRPNGLVDEASPYLLQHAYNPVNWRPWGPAALAEAKAKGRPIFLSIGYSTCHWCHVMEKESFESEEVARVLNRDYIPIKLDRETRPDLDELFMESLMRFSGGGGGWPMSLFLTPEGQPFTGATYIPRRVFLQILAQITEEWDTNREELLEVGEIIAEAVKSSVNERGEAGEIALALADRAALQLEGAFDPEHGGFSLRGPKFPRAMTLQFLMRSARRTGRARTLEVIRKTLDEMAAGGIFDQVGGGFHRYSVDREWTVPHFEKMLYDNGILLSVYAQAFQLTGDEAYRRVALETADWLCRDMVLPSGGLASARDADSAGEEGLFYLWTPAELRAALPEAQARLLIAHYGVTEAGNFEDAPGRSILRVVTPLAEVAAAQGLALEEAKAQLKAAKARLRAARGERIAPLKDDKVITAWNGLAIAGLAATARIAPDAAREAALLEVARGAAAHALKVLRRADGRLLRAARRGLAQGLGTLDDYAYLVDGLFELFMATGEARWLTAALELEAQTRALFWDAEAGGFVRTAADVTDVPIRSRDTADGARPAPPAVAARNLLRVAELTRQDGLREQVQRVLELEASRIEGIPLAYVSLLSVAEALLSPPREVVVVADSAAAGRPLLRAVHAAFLPDTVIVPLLGPEAEAVRGALAGLCEGRGTVDGAAAAWVCQERRCLAPLTEVEALRAALSDAHEGDEEPEGGEAEDGDDE